MLVVLVDVTCGSFDRVVVVVVVPGSSAILESIQLSRTLFVKTYSAVFVLGFDSYIAAFI